MSINERFKLFRIMLKMTQQEMADSLGVKRVTISHMETSHITMTTGHVISLVEKFNLNPNWLFLNMGSMTLTGDEKLGETINDYNMKDIEFFKRIIEEKDKIIEEKERTIRILLTK